MALANGVIFGNETYCHELPLNECTRDADCVQGVGECDDIVLSSMTFSFLFVLYASLKIYVFPLTNLKYSFLDMMKFDMLFKDQVLFLLLAVSGVSR